ncbi:hypothetical protein [Alkaliphilus transvaalensis]|uniref:hypothetical protein n=1 Tax=Alkaliphilus transvaalensis TaxID=114628 RepID=UPI000479EC85|nr:hypothetical protein [Alkaliphilus transvaalensis]
MKEHRIQKINSKLKNLFPSGDVSWLYLGSKDYAGAYYKKVDFDGGHIYLVSGKPRYQVKVYLSSTGLWELTILLKLLEFSSSEKRILAVLQETLASSLSESNNELTRLSSRIGSFYAFEIVLISRILKKTMINRFWTITEITENLKNLTYKRYEGSPATSGFIYTSQPEKYIKALDLSKVEYEEFADEVIMSDEYFSSPASYRYVDGRNSFYLVNNYGNVIGVIRNKKASMFSIVDRCSEKMYSHFVDKMPGRTWIGYVGLNDDINIVVDKHSSFKWSDNNWYVRDRSIIKKYLVGYGCDDGFADNLVDIIYTLSELRHGTVICIPIEKSTPPVIGKIDTSIIGGMLRDKFASRKFSELLESNQAIGLLASDGLTTISQLGTIISCGDIIDITAATKGKVTGGGRSQAACAASYYGLSIKVSEDGPISLFLNGDKIIEMH